MLTMYKVISWIIFLNSYITGTIYFFNYNNPEFIYLGFISVFSFLLGIILLLQIEIKTNLNNNIFILLLTFTTSILMLIFIVRLFYTLHQGFVTNDYWLLTFLLSLIIISYLSFYKYLILVSGIKKRESY